MTIEAEVFTYNIVCISRAGPEIARSSLPIAATISRSNDRSTSTGGEDDAAIGSGDQLSRSSLSRRSESAGGEECKEGQCGEMHVGEIGLLESLWKD